MARFSALEKIGANRVSTPSASACLDEHGRGMSAYPRLTPTFVLTPGILVPLTARGVTRVALGGSGFCTAY